MTITSRDYLFDPPAEGLRGLTLPGVFASAAALAPGATAATDGRRSWTWEQWESDARTLAAGLQRCGVRPGDVVAVQLPNSWEFLTAHVAVALTGAVMLPLSTAYGPGDVTALAERAEPVRTITAASYGRLFADGAGGHPEPVDVRPGMPFVAIPSSGTTSGRPKICLHTHDGLLTNAATVTDLGTADGSDVLLSASPFTHMFGLGSIHLGLLSGASHALLPAWDAGRCLELAAASRASVLYAVPTQLHDLLARHDGRPGGFPRSVHAAGAVVPPALIDRVRERLGSRVTVVWGMSELGSGITTHAQDTTASLGRPVPGARARVVDGVLEFRGPSLFRAYLHDTERTAAALTPDGWLRTGDLARIGADGQVEYLGRSSELINVGGNKVVVREVEDLLTHLGHIALVGKADVRLGEYPCLVTERDGVTLDEVTGVLRAAGVAEYKWPLEVVGVDRVPLTPSGKIDRAAAAKLVARRDDPTEVPVSDLLHVVRSCALRITGGADLMPADATFRDTGLDSVAAVRFSKELARAIGRPLPTSVAFDHPTPRELADHLGRAERTAPPPGFEQTFRLLCEADPHAAADLIRAAARLRPVFGGPEAVAARALRLSAGPQPPVVVCFPSVFPLSSPTEFKEFAEAFTGTMDVHAVALPGFDGGQGLPADLDALAASIVLAVDGLAGDRPYVLCGHSSGGWIAHLAAERLRTRPPAGVVLLDSEWPGPGFVREQAPLVLPIAVRREKSLGIEEVGMVRLTATGGYLRLLEDWAPARLPTPVLHVAAETEGATWPRPHEAVVVPGDHMSMLRPAGAAVASWARSLTSP